MEESRIRAVVDYGERLKTRSENDVLYQKITSFISIRVYQIVLVIIILVYFRNLVLSEKKSNGYSTPSRVHPGFEKCTLLSDHQMVSNNKMRFLI